MIVAIALAAAILAPAPVREPRAAQDTELGWRARDPAPIRVVVGDSFAWGPHVREGEEWPALLGATNRAVCGYGYDQIVMAAERVRGESAGAEIIAALIPDDVRRAGLSVYLHAPKPWFTSAGAAVLPGAGPQARSVVLTHQDIAAVVDALTARLASANVRLIVLYCGQDEPVGLARHVVASARRHGVPLLDLMPKMRREHYLRLDGHPNARGHRLIARRVAEALKGNA